MLKGYSSDYKTLVLLRVVKKLMSQTQSYGIYRLEKILRDKREAELMPVKPLKKILDPKKRAEEIRKEVKNKLSSNPQRSLDSDSLFASRKISNDVVIAETERSIQRKSPPGVMPVAPRRRIIDTQNELPAHLQYLKPVRAESRANLDLKSLNPLIQDPNVKVIECEGENEFVVVSGSMGRKPTATKLTAEEINEVINIFSKASKIPISEGLFKVTVGNLQFTAMISESISSRFIIKKI